MDYSHSQLETYRNCPFKYKLQYMDRIRTKRRSIEAFMGTMVHEALERLYRDLMMSRCPELEDIHRFYLDRWEEKYGGDVFIVREEYGPEDYRQTGMRCISDYYRRYHPFEGNATLGLEKRVNIPVSDEEGRLLRFSGILDRLDSPEAGRYEIHDYKTSGSLPTRQELEGDRQLSIYQLAVEDGYPDAVDVELVWHYLVFDRELRLRRTPEELRAVAAEAASTVREIETASDFPARESQLCLWCELQEHCPLRKHILKVAKIAHRELGTDHGMQLVDSYAEWTERKQEAENRLRELREEILEFSSYNDVDNIQGTFHVLKINRVPKPKLPSGSSEEREKLEGILRDEGVRESVSSLSSSRLGKALSNGSLGRHIAERLEPLIEWEEVPYLRIYGGKGA